MGFRFTTRPGHPTFVDLPWEQPLSGWTSDRLVSPVRGISRHVVRFVAYGPDLYALKEPPVGWPSASTTPRHGARSRLSAVAAQARGRPDKGPRTGRG